MKRLLLLKCLLLVTIVAMADTIIVKNIDELNAANKKAQPGDIILLQDGDWRNVTIKLNCTGTKEKPITFKAQTPGKVLVTGLSQLRLGGNFIVVDGLYFVNGHAGKDPVINFRVDSKQLANNCRVTNTVVNDFNNPQRMDENNWVLFYGKNNRLDHCSFKDKKNMGVLLAVILDDERSRENFHLIDHNYFGRRPPLASNGGEIIRVGVSQHCEFNSNTQINDNFFEYCDGETEIISIKSGSNIVKGNTFKESQGSVVLRHGNFNTVENNIFLGYGKAGTGGVRVINKGQWVINNYFYKCRGVDFRSPLSIMNGIPNSPANRYVQVTDAVIANNTFYDCTPASFCEGSDAERTLPPDNVLLMNNIFYNNRDTAIYKAFDEIKGFQFTGNEVSKSVKQQLIAGFDKTGFTIHANTTAPFPRTLTKGAIAMPDSISRASQGRLEHPLSTKPGFTDLELLKTIYNNAVTNCGAAWIKALDKAVVIQPVTVKCATAEEIYQQLERKEPVTIQLTGKDYQLTKPFVISKTVQFTGKPSSAIKFNSGEILAVFLVAGNGHLSLDKVNINGSTINAEHFISSDSSGSSAHYNVVVTNCKISNLGTDTKCKNIFYAYKSMVADSIVFRNNSFEYNHGNGFIMDEEKDDKGYYNAEKIIVSDNNFANQLNTLVNIYRGGNDESTLGPQFTFSGNRVSDCHTGVGTLMSFTGVQVTNIINNKFHNCNPGATLVTYKDTVRARHLFEKNTLSNAGSVAGNGYVVEKNNIIK